MLIRFFAPFTPLLSKRLFQHVLRFIPRATFCGSLSESETQKVLRVLVEGLTDAVCYTANWLKSSPERLSEKSRMHPRRGPAGHRKGVFQPISSSAYWPNPCSERCSYPLFGQSQKMCSRKLRLLHPASHTRLIVQVLLSESAFQIPHRSPAAAREYRR
jgi:hypothetical protein